MSNHDPVDHPSHYTQGAVECIDAIEAALGEEGFIAFLRGQIMKYTWRLGLKGAAEEDAGKIAWYADRLEHALAGRVPVPEVSDYWASVAAGERPWLRDVARSAEPPARDQFRVQYNSVTFKDDVRPHVLAGRVPAVEEAKGFWLPEPGRDWKPITA